METHRVRFLNIQPSAIVCIKSTPDEYPYPPITAVARENGDLELWQLFGSGALPVDSTNQSFVQTSDSYGSLINNNSKNIMVDGTSGVCRYRVQGEQYKKITALHWSLWEFQPFSSAQYGGQRVGHDSATDSEAEEDNEDDCKVDAQQSQNAAVQQSVIMNRLVARLFVGYSDGSIAEFTLPSQDGAIKYIKRTVISNSGGEICGLAVSPSQQYLIAGFQNGYIRTYDLTLYNEMGLPTFDYLRSFDPVNEQLTCLGSMNICLGSEQSHDYVNADSDSQWRVLVGGDNGIIRVYNGIEGRQVELFKLASQSSHGAGDRQSPAILCLTQLKCNEDEQLFAAGDSMGNIRIWDLITGTLVQSLIETHVGAVVALSSTLDRKSFVSCGMDGKIALYNYVDGAGNTPYQQLVSRKLHTHDIYAIEWLQVSSRLFTPSRSTNSGNKRKLTVQAMVGKDSAHPLIYDAFISGGVDTMLTVLNSPQSKFIQSFVQPARIASFSSGRYKMFFNAQSNLLISLINQQIQVYSLGVAHQHGEDVGFVPTKSDCKFVCKLTLNSSPVDACASEQLDSFAVAYTDKVILFKLFSENGQYHMQKLWQHSVSNQVERIFLVDNVGILVACLDGQSSCLCLQDGSVKSEFQLSNVMCSSRCVTVIGNRFLVSLGLNTAIEIRDLTKFKPYSKLAKVSDHFSFLVIDGSVDGVYEFSLASTKYSKRCLYGMLLSQRASNGLYKFHLFDLEKAKPMVELNKVLNNYKILIKRREQIVGALSSVENGRNYLFIYSHKWVCRVGVDQILKMIRKIGDSELSTDQYEECFSWKHDLSNLLYFDVQNMGSTKSEMKSVMVERPWDMIRAQLPAPIELKQFKRK
ncbi:hypothetical protein MIR68_009880 [Amoeboaphelidium protococcarum]|nr:hypothetical protein MIR68_009880 [Amoeboaphelidium protococcarum]